MAISYNDWKKKYEGLNDAQRQNYLNMTKNDATAQQYMTQYNNEKNTVYTPSTTQNVTQPTNTFGDTGGASQAKQYTGTGVTSAGNYNYNPNLKTNQLTSGSLVFGTNAENTESRTPGYLEQRNNAIANALYNEGKTDENSVRNYLSTFSDFRNYDQLGQNNTVTAIMKRMGNLINTQGNKGTNGNQDLNSRLQSEIWDNYNNNKKGYSDLMGGGANYYDNFWDAVNGKLKEAYGINNLDEFRAKYPEQYESLQQALSNVEGVWNATDPNERQMLDGRLQAIIGTGVGAGSDFSKLKVLESTLIDKFKDPDKIKQDAQNVIKLQTEGKNTQQIANEMGVSEDQVKQLILLANGLDSKAGEYYQLKDNVSKDITEPYDTKIARLEEEKKIALDRANRNVDWLKQDFDTNLERQKQQNDINAHNADAIAGRTGLAFSKRGIEGINYTATQAQQIIDDLTKNYDRNNQQMADGIADIIRNWQWNNQDLMKASEDALTRAKNSFTANTLAIQQQYGTVGLQAQQQLANNVQAFITEAEGIYDNALARQQQNLSNLITNVSNLNALAAQNLTLRQAKIEQFQSEALNMNRSELQNLANQLGMDQAAYGDLISYQAQAIQNQLNGYVPGAGVMFQDQISSLLESGANGQEVLQWVMNQPEFKQMTQTGGTDNWAMNNGIMYNKNTGEYMDLNGNTWNKLNDTTLYNPATGQTMSIDGLSGISGGVTGTGFQSVQEGLQSFVNQHQIGSTGGQCGAFVNDYLQSLGLDRVFTDPITDKTGAINTQKGYIPQVGDVAVMDSPSAPQYGHVAIVTGVEQDGKGNYKITTLESNKKGEESVFTRTFTPSTAKNNSNYVYGYYHPEVQGNAGGDMGALTDYGVPISYDRSVKALIPTQLMNSELELTKLENNISNLYKQGISAEDAVLTYMGFNIKKEEDKDLAINLVNSVRSLSNEDNVQSAISYISQRINAGDYNSAIKKVENLVKAEAKKNEGDGYFDESTARGIVQKANDLIKLANSMPQNIGLFDGTMQKYLKNLKSSDAAKLQTAISYLTDEQRLRQVGSNVTESELQMVKNWIPQLNDRTDTFMNKINQMKQNALTNLNSWRATYGLPILDETTLLDNSNRIGLYDGTYTDGNTVFKSLGTGGGRMITGGGRS